MKGVVTGLGMALLAWSFVATDALAVGRWQQVENQTNCVVWNPHPKPKETVVWDGACVDGFAEGDGVMHWFSDGKKISYGTYDAKIGITMKKGRPFPLVTNDDIDLKLVDCKRVLSFVNKNFDLGHPDVEFAVLKIAVDFHRASCPKSGRVSVCAFKRGQEGGASCGYMFLGSRFKAVVSDGGYEIMVGSYGNSYADARRKKIKQEIRREESAKLRREEEAKRQKIARQEETRRNSIRAAKLKEFGEIQQRGGFKKIVSAQKLIMNPFLFEGATIGTVTTFSRMVSKTRAYLDPGLIITNVKPELFKSRFSFILSGIVRGVVTTDVISGAKQIYPLVEFKNLTRCADLKKLTCDELK